MLNVVKITTVYLIVATLFAGCGGGSKPPVDNTPPPPALSSDASLSNLTVSTGSFNEAFSASTHAYTQDTGASELSATPFLSDANASVTVDGSAISSGSASPQIALALGSNTITVVVTAEDGTTTQTYTVDVTRSNNDASLSALSLSAGDLDQIFQSSLEAYSGTTGFLNSSSTVTATTTEPNASLTINGVAAISGMPSDSIGLAEGSNSILVVVTAEDGVSTQTYSIDIIRQAVTNFAQQAYIKASNTGAADVFGYTLALSGDTLAVSALGEKSSATGVDGNQADNSEPLAGAVYVFTRDPAGIWSQQAYIKASTVDEEDLFGRSIALDGDTLVVGADGDDSSATGVNGDQSDNSLFQAGAAYVFTRDAGGNWSQQAYLKASNTGYVDGFGYSVSLSGDTLAVGAYNEWSAATGVDGDQADDSAGGAGAVYMFVRDSSGVWTQQAYLKASNTDPGDWFGYSVALSTDTLAVGALFEGSSSSGIDGDQTDNNASKAGAVYVFKSDGVGNWSQQAYVKASNADANDWFGNAVAIDIDTLAVGANSEDSMARGINGDQIDDSADQSGAVYVFKRNEMDVWTQQAYIKASNADPNDLFGDSLAISGDTLVVKATGEASTATGINGDQMDNFVVGGAGAAYVFSRDLNGTWSQAAYVKASNTEFQDSGSDPISIALDGNTMALGMQNEDSAATGIGGDQSDNSAASSGAVYVYQ